ncbi:MAG: hypothetical protein JNL23_12475 [Chitinophagaceae bacterium]|nr:hypothetical protein [Chitinophagaceae bacterium]
MKSRTKALFIMAIVGIAAIAISSFSGFTARKKYTLIPTPKFHFNSFVDCNMAEAWIADTFRIFPGKYGEDPLWGYAHDLKFANGKNADEAFSSKQHEFTEPVLPTNAAPGTAGLHGAVWFETIYQDGNDKSGKTLFAVYHNENYPATLPYNAATGEGYIDKNWPQGLTGAATPAAVCRIGIMKSTDGGRSWVNKGIFIEDKQPRMILKPHNTSVTFAGGVGDPSAVASGEWLYLFYGEYGYPGVYNNADYNAEKEWSGQCISIARIKIADLDNPAGKAKRWDGNGFNAPYDGIGAPISSIQIPVTNGGGPTSSPQSKYHWGPSVSWNTYLQCWVMLMATAEGPSWKGGDIYISFNKNVDLNKGNNSQQWSKPELLISKPGHTVWYPSLQPLNTEEDIANKNTCLKLGKTARLFFKDMHGDTSEYYSEYIIQFKK